MKIVIAFDEASMAEKGIQREDVRHTVKKLFAERGLPCVEDGAELAFEDAGQGDGYADMWLLIMGLLKSDWFVASAASCVWHDEDGEEDVLAQAWKVRESI